LRPANFINSLFKLYIVVLHLPRAVHAGIDTLDRHVRDPSKARPRAAATAEKHTLTLIICFLKYDYKTPLEVTQAAARSSKANNSRHLAPLLNSIAFSLLRV
jgi:hypothetical protein